MSTEKYWYLVCESYLDERKRICGLPNHLTFCYTVYSGPTAMAYEKSYYSEGYDEVDNMLASVQQVMNLTKDKISFQLFYGRKLIPNGNQLYRHYVTYELEKREALVHLTSLALSDLYLTAVPLCFTTMGGDNTQGIK